VIEDSVRRLWKTAANWLGLHHMQRILRELRHRGVRLERVRALEVFGYTGERLTRIYAPHVASVEVWEIDPNLEEALRRNVPGATVRITDSYKEVETTQETFDLVVIDNSIGIYGGRCDHYDLFPGITRILSPDAIMVVLLVTRYDDVACANYPEILTEEYLARRRSFYEIDDAKTAPTEELIQKYIGLLREHGFETEWYFLQTKRELHRLLPRRVGVGYLVLKCRRSEPTHADARRGHVSTEETPTSRDTLTALIGETHSLWRRPCSAGDRLRPGPC